MVPPAAAASSSSSSASSSLAQQTFMRNFISGCNSNNETTEPTSNHRSHRKRPRDEEALEIIVIDDDTSEDDGDEENNAAETLETVYWQVDKPCLFSIDGFLNMLAIAEKNCGHKIEDIEESKLIRAANSKLDVSDTKEQKKAQYGRLLPQAADQLFRQVLKLEQNDVFVDIGHGIGSLVLQAAYTVGCEARGIEVVQDRNFVATLLRDELEQQRGVRNQLITDSKYALELQQAERVEQQQELHHNAMHPPCNMEVGEIHLVHGSLQDPQYRQFLSIPDKVTKAFCNNFNDVFGEKSKKPCQKYVLNDYIGALFALMKEGSILVSLDPLNLPPELDEINRYRQKEGLPADPHASFYTKAEINLGYQKDIFSWSQQGSCTTEVKAIVYTRVGPLPSSFLCCNANCRYAQQSTRISATVASDYGKEIEALVSNTKCPHCHYAPMTLRKRTLIEKRSYCES